MEAARRPTKLSINVPLTERDVSGIGPQDRGSMGSREIGAVIKLRLDHNDYKFDMWISF